MNISDIRTRLDAAERTKLSYDERRRAKYPGRNSSHSCRNAELNEPESSIITDPLIQALLDKLPAAKQHLVD